MMVKSVGALIKMHVMTRMLLTVLHSLYFHYMFQPVTGHNQIDCTVAQKRPLLYKD